MFQDPHAAFLKTLEVFLNEPTKKFSGLDICNKTGLKSGTVYPLLIGMEEKGWLVSEWEDIDPEVEKRPKRHFYSLSEKGNRRGREMIKERDESSFSDSDLVPVLS